MTEEVKRTKSDQLRSFVRGAYDLQKVRIEIGNRLVGNFRVKLGQKPGKKEEELDNESLKVLKAIRASYKKIADGVVSRASVKHFKGDKIISSYSEFCMVRQYMEVLKSEESHFRVLISLLRDFPIWTEYLKGITGCGPTLAAFIIAEVDISKSKYPESLWKYCGLDVAEDGKARSRRKEHQIDIEYVGRDGETKTKKSLTFKPMLQSKLVAVLGPSFIKCKSPYAEVYYNYKHRLEHHNVYKDTTKLHRHRMAVRYMVKRFLVDLHVKWREIEGLPVSEEYAVKVLGLKHNKDRPPRITKVKGVA